MQYNSLIDYFDVVDYFNTGECLFSTKISVPLDNNDGLESIVSSSYRRAPFIAFVILCNEDKSIKGLGIMPNSLRALKKISSSDILNWLLNNYVEIVIIPKTDIDLLNTVKRSEVRFRLVDPGLTLNEVIEVVFKA